MKHIKLFEQFVTEKKVDYQVYHDSYAEAITAALEYAKASGYEVDEDDEIIKKSSTFIINVGGVRVNTIENTGYESSISSLISIP